MSFRQSSLGLRLLLHLTNIAGRRSPVAQPFRLCSIAFAPSGLGVGGLIFRGLTAPAKRCRAYGTVCIYISNSEISRAIPARRDTPHDVNWQSSIVNYQSPPPVLRAMTTFARANVSFLPQRRRGHREIRFPKEKTKRGMKIFLFSRPTRAAARTFARAKMCICHKGHKENQGRRSPRIQRIKEFARSPISRFTDSPIHRSTDQLINRSTDPCNPLLSVKSVISLPLSARRPGRRIMPMTGKREVGRIAAPAAGRESIKKIPDPPFPLFPRSLKHLGAFSACRSPGSGPWGGIGPQVPRRPDFRRRSA